MNESPPEPSASPRRPGNITAAAVVMFIIAGLNLLGGIALVAGADRAETAETIVRVVGIMDIVIGAVQIYAGVKIWALDESGRSIGVVVSAIGVGLAVLAIARGGVGQLLGLAMNA